MKTPRLPVLVALCAVLAFLTCPSRAQSSADESLPAIFNGKDLSGWRNADHNTFWRVEDGILIGESDGKLSEDYLLTEQEYGDFVLEFEVLWTGEVDTGIDFRKPRIQLQLGVSRSLKRDMSGSFYVGKPGYPDAGQAKTANQLMHGDGQWNRFRLEAVGSKFSVWINGQKTVEYVDAGFPGTAPIGLQIHGGLRMKAEYRNIRAKKL